MKPKQSRMWLPGEQETINEEDMEDWFGIKKQKFDELRQKAIEAIEQKQASFLATQAKKPKPHQFKMGQQVLVKDHRSSKFAPKYYGPFFVQRVISDSVLELRDPISQKLDQIHANYVKPYYSRDHSPSPSHRGFPEEGLPTDQEIIPATEYFPAEEPEHELILENDFFEESEDFQPPAYKSSAAPPAQPAVAFKPSAGTGLASQAKSLAKNLTDRFGSIAKGFSDRITRSQTQAAKKDSAPSAATGGIPPRVPTPQKSPVKPLSPAQTTDAGIASPHFGGISPTTVKQILSPPWLPSLSDFPPAVQLKQEAITPIPPASTTVEVSPSPKRIPDAPRSASRGRKSLRFDDESQEAAQQRVARERSAQRPAKRSSIVHDKGTLSDPESESESSSFSSSSDSSEEEDEFSNALSQTGTPTQVRTPAENLSLGPKKTTVSKGATAIDPITPSALKRKTEVEKLLEAQVDFNKSAKRIARRKELEQKKLAERAAAQTRLLQPRGSLTTKEVQKGSRPAPPLVKPPAAQTKIRPPASKAAVVPKR
jgi:hypothetical protein